MLDEREYTLEDFSEYLIANQGELLEGRARKEVKAYLFLNTQPWESFFDCANKRFGDLTTVTVPPKEGRDRTPEVYYKFEPSAGVSLVFSLATKEEFESAFLKPIRRKRGVAEVWVRPLLGGKIREHILQRYPETRINYFVARRGERDIVSCKEQPTKRRFSYTGKDGRYVMEQAQYLYGVTPISISYEMTSLLKLKVYEEGLVILRTINDDTFNLALEIVNMIVDETQQARLAAIRMMNTEVKSIEVEGGYLRVPEAFVGEIRLSKNPGLDEGKALDFVKNAEGFSFLDVVVEGGSLTFSATVIDDKKESVFGLSASEDTMRLVPRFNPTFETYLKFCRQVAELIDEKAELLEA